MPGVFNEEQEYLKLEYLKGVNKSEGGKKEMGARLCKDKQRSGVKFFQVHGTVTIEVLKQDRVWPIQATESG